ncbi:MAG TPA: hypothetical protein VM674_04450 [Candidatus Acidoferrum sp.]|nr:hypothetical protein [Candidatus Acidoferrum sp.]
MAIDPDQIDPGRMQWNREAAGANAEIQDGRPRAPGEIQPRPQVGGIGKAGVELGEPGIWIRWIVANDRRRR